MTRQIFSLNQARALLPQVKLLTADAVIRAEAVSAELQRLSEADPAHGPLAETLREIVDSWADAVRGLGYEVHSHVGDARLRVDLAVVDPRQPSRYALGIECDGDSYRAARSARDRDRLRQQVLGDRGWVIHRVWIGDWFRRPEEQLRAVAASIERAKAEWDRRDGP